MTFIPARPPRQHQLRGFLLSCDSAVFALLMEMRTGKTKIVLDTTVYQYELGAIDALLVVAWPAGVHRNWIEDEVPKDVPERIPHSALAWRSGRTHLKAYKQALEDLLTFKGLAILGVNAEALTSEVCKTYLRRFLKARRLLVAADECFPAGTMVGVSEGDRPIEEIKIGDVITSSDGSRRVNKVFIKSSNHLVKLHLSDGSFIKCTPNHPLFTDVGWVCAGNLLGRRLYGRAQSGRRDDLRILRENLHSAFKHAPSEDDEILREILLSEVADATTRASRQGVPPGGSSQDRGDFDRVQAHDAIVEQGAVMATDYTPEDKSSSFEKRPHLQGARRQREDLEVSEAASDRISLAVETGARHYIGRKAARLSNLLQGRSGMAGEKVSDRGRRIVSSESTTEGAGPQEDYAVGELRVVSVENLKLNHPVDVYSLEIEGCPHFFAEGVLVHNSSWMKTPGAKRSKTMRSIGRNPNVVFKRILDGTPLETPLDLYNQFAFLDPAILGQPDFATFKAHYSEWEDKKTKAGQGYKVLTRYTNLDELQARMAPHSYRVLRRDCADLPPKTYRRLFVPLSPEQRRVYDDLRATYRAELRDGRQVNAAMVLTRYLRLQQVLSNRYPGEVAVEVCAGCDGDGCAACGDEGVTRYRTLPTIIDHQNHPRLAALKEELRETRPVIVWARFRDEIDEILALAAELGRRPCRYDGTVSDDEKLAARRGFAAGRFDTFVGNQRAGGRGVKLAAAEAMIYYSNQYSLLDRLQSEDRAEDLGRAVSTEVIDLVAEDTVDEPIVEALRSKKRIADLVTGDAPGAWL